MNRNPAIPTLSPHQFLWLVLILLLAAALRIYHITQQSIWFDEAFAWNIIQQHDMYPRIIADTHPPLYFVLLRGWVAVAGDSALALRYLSAMLSMLTVALIYRVARALVYRHPELATVPLLAALLLALSDAEIFLAQEARNYSIYTAAATYSMWMYLRWLRTGARGSAVGWVSGTAVLLYTHYQAALIPAVQFLHILLFLRGRKRRDAILILAAGGAIFAPWFVGVTIPQARHAIDASLPYAIPSNWQTFLHLRDNYLGAQWALLVALAVVGLYTLVGSRISQRDAAKGLKLYDFSAAFLVFMWFALPFTVLFFGNYFQSLLTERKLLIVAPALALMIAIGLGALKQPGRGLLVAAILVYSISSVDYYRVKEPWKVITAAPVPYVQPTDLAMVEAGVGQYAVKYYWEHLLPESVYLTTFPFPQIRDWTLAPTTDSPTYYNALLPQLLEETKSNRIGSVATVWFLYWDKEQTNFERLAQAGFTRTMTFSVSHLDNIIYLYRYDHLLPQALADFDNGMILRAAEIDPESLRVDLWWETSLPLTVDYTSSVKLYDADGRLIAQHDSPSGQQPTTTWTTADTVYDGKFLEMLPDHDATLAPGIYTVTVQVYQWTPDAIINVPLIDGTPRIEIGTITR